jgi:hypothetical protein
MISFSLDYELPPGEGLGDAIISLAVHIDEGFPLSGKRYAVEQLLVIYKQIWEEGEEHDNALRSLFTQQIPLEVQPTLRSFDGTELLLMRTRACYISTSRPTLSMPKAFHTIPICRWSRWPTV